MAELKKWEPSKIDRLLFGADKYKEDFYERERKTFATHVRFYHKMVGREKLKKSEEADL